MDWIIWFSCILLMFIAVTIFHSLLMPSPPSRGSVSGQPLVSILVPMRDEIMNVKGMIECLKKQTYPHLEVLLLDDESTDGTTEALQLAVRGDERFRILNGTPKPPEWIGKVYACHQLNLQARGDFLLFIDADVRIEPDAVNDSLAFMQQKKISLMSGFSRFLLPTWLNKLLVPMQHFIVLFHLPMLFANWTKWPAATAAHGGFMFFERHAYEAIGGHESVKGNIVEDVAISKRMKAHGFRMWIVNVTRFASCTMYHTNYDVWKGFSKNIFNGLGRSVPLALIVIIFYGFFYVGSGILFGLALIVEDIRLLLPYVFITIQAAIVYAKTREPIHLAFVLPFSALALISLLLHAMWKSLKGQQVEWKGRFYG